MSVLLIALILSITIAFFATVTRSKDPNQETQITFALKITVIGFVIIYFGLGYLQQPNCPEIELGEPDF